MYFVPRLEQFFFNRKENFRQPRLFLHHRKNTLVHHIDPQCRRGPLTRIVRNSYIHCRRVAGTIFLSIRLHGDFEIVPPVDHHFSRITRHLPVRKDAVRMDGQRPKQILVQRYRNRAFPPPEVNGFRQDGLVVFNYVYKYSLPCNLRA